MYILFWYASIVLYIQERTLYERLFTMRYIKNIVFWIWLFLSTPESQKLFALVTAVDTSTLQKRCVIESFISARAVAVDAWCHV